MWFIWVLGLTCNLSTGLACGDSVCDINQNAVTQMVNAIVEDYPSENRLSFRIELFTHQSPVQNMFVQISWLCDELDA